MSFIREKERSSGACYSADDLEDTALRDRSSTQKANTAGLHLQKQVRRLRKQISGGQGLGGRVERIVTANGYGVSSWGDENVLELDSGGGHATL